MATNIMASSTITRPVATGFKARATLASCFELGCSTLLVLGLASRLATLPLLGMILTIQLFVYPDAWSEHLVWASILLFLLTRGPGAISLDRALGLERGN